MLCTFFFLFHLVMPSSPLQSLNLLPIPCGAFKVLFTLLSLNAPNFFFTLLSSNDPTFSHSPLSERPQLLLYSALLECPQLLLHSLNTPNFLFTLLFPDTFTPCPSPMQTRLATLVLFISRLSYLHFMHDLDLPVMGRGGASNSSGCSLPVSAHWPPLEQVISI